MLNPYSTWPGLAQVYLYLRRYKYRLERQFQYFRSGQCYRTSHQVELGITSLSRTNTTPARLLKIRRAHWGIETGLHYRRDVTFKEDAISNDDWTHRPCDGIHQQSHHCPSRQAKFQITAQARRWFAAHISDAFSLLTRPYSLLEKTIGWVKSILALKSALC